jgi:uncharacterized membrane protein
MLTRLRRKIERTFLAGLIVTVPTMLIFFLLKFLVNYIDKVSAPIVQRFFHTNIPGIGMSVTILLVLVIGFLGTNILGKKLVVLGDRLLSKIPLVRSIYTSAKQMIETVFFAASKPFQQVVLVPYPMNGVYAIGLVTREVSPNIAVAQTTMPERHDDDPQEADDKVFSVFIPSTPNFTSGLLVMFPKRDIIPLSLTVEEGFKYLMTGGILVPKKEEFEEEKLEEWDLFLY